MTDRRPEKRRRPAPRRAAETTEFSADERAALQRTLEDLEHSRRQIEHARQEWSATFDAIKDPVFLHDADGRIVRANSAYAARAGMSFEQILGRFYWEVFPRGDGPMRSCAQAWQTGEERQVEEIALAGGEVIVSRAFTIPGLEGESKRSVHILEDVTDQRRAEAEQLVLGAALRQAVEAVVVTDRDRLITYINPAFQTLLGYAPDEVLGRSVESVLGVPGGAGESHPDQVIDRLGADGVWSGEAMRRAKDGTGIPVYLSSVAVRDERGDTIGSLATYLDLRPIRRAEEKLRESEARYRALTENSTDVSSVIGTDGITRYISPSVEQLLGYRPDELIGTSPTERVFPDDVERVRATIAAALSEPGSKRTVEFRYRHKNGEWLYLESCGRFVPEDPSIDGMVINTRDVTDRKRADQSLQRVNRALKTLSECNQALVRFDDELALFHEVCRIIVYVGGYRLAWVISHVDGSSEPPVLVSQVHADAPFTDLIPVAGADDTSGRHPCQRALRERVPQTVPDVRTDADFASWRDDALRRGVVSLASLPLMDRGEAIGVLSIGAAETGVFDAEEMDLLVKLAADLAHGITTVRARVARDQALRERQQAQDSLHASLISAIGAIGATLEMRDPYTAGHQRRVAELAVAIARELRLPDAQIEGIHFGALIHDVGKIQVPGEILSKPGKLTAIEYELIKNHPQAGYEILQGVRFPWPIAQMVLQHHERLDGSGYPAGLKGAEVLLEARILCVADVVEAISSHRPYRPTLGVDRALQEIREYRGTRYDPEVVDACIDLFGAKRFVFSH
jgi:PAS domain S-box-containing protein/putative nucleotidyltransferase with HDIG domain